MTTKKQLNIRVSAETKKKLQFLAKGTTVTALIEGMIDAHYQLQKRRSK